MEVLIARDIVGKLTERALIQLYYGFGLTGAILSMFSEVMRMLREHAV